MNNKILIGVIGLISILLTSSVWALNLADPGNNISMQKANETLNEVYAKLNAGTMLDSKLYNLIQSIKAYREKAQGCVEQGRDQIKSIDAILDDQYLGNAIKQNAADYQYLRERRSTIASSAAACSIFMYKAQALLDNYGDAIKQHVSSVKPQQVEPVWSVLDNDIMRQFDVSTEKLYQSSGLQNLTINNIYGLFALLLISLAISALIYSFCKNLLASNNDQNMLANHSARIVKRYIFLLLPITSIALLLHAVLFKLTPSPMIVLVVYGVLAYIFAIALANYMLYLPTKYQYELLKKGVKKTIFLRFFLVATIILIGYLAALFLRSQELTQDFVNIIRAFYLTVLIAATFWLCWAVFRIPFFTERNKSFLTLSLRLVLIAGFIALVASEWLGYHYTTAYIITGFVLTAFFTILVWGAIALLERTFYVLEDSHYRVSQMLRRATDMKPNRDFVEFYILRIAFYILLTGVVIIAMMHIWGMPLYSIDVIQTGLIKGFPLLGIMIYPLQIAAGLAIFSVIHMLGRIYSARIARKNQFHAEHDRQVAIASVMTYVTFFIALVTGLLVAGVNFTGLAIIAGALSVGIGFGLQNIANNFLSGLILLIQKPVKPGDRVAVGGIEGFITKIRVLQTQIKTLAREDVIIPNSDLISNPVTNYMFRDSFWRVSCKVGVAYGSDTDLVKKLLIEAALSHPDVLDDELNAPVVLFKDFGDSALMFELWTIIRDVNKKFRVASDLNFTIDTLFRQHNVVIAFPQRDLHIKEIIRTDANKVDDKS